MSSKVHALGANDTVALASDLSTLAGDTMKISVLMDGSGKIKPEYLPSYVDDVLEYANKAAFPATGETGKIYVDLATDRTWRWSGTTYTEIAHSQYVTGTYDFASMKGLFTAVRDVVVALGGTVTNFPAMT